MHTYTHTHIHTLNTYIHTYIHILGLQLKTKPINVALKDMVLIQYWELHVHITTHETTNVQKISNDFF